MSTSPENDDEHRTPPEKSTVILLLKDMGDTTWRMFVPTIGGFLAGSWADGYWRTEPWLAILGLLIGIGVTILLVRQQLKGIKIR